MSTRLDTALQKHPEHEEGIRLLAERDPSGKLKYLNWGTKILASGQALAAEVADVLDLYHRFAGRALEPPPGRRLLRRNERVHPDIHTYAPGDLAKLRDLLVKMRRAADKKRRKRERLYKIEGAVEADTVYDSDDLIVRHIKNKQASVHYGLNTKWCIAMLRDGYFEEYEAHNATFFFFERKTPVGNEYDKVALMIPRSGDHRDRGPTAFTTLDQPVDMLNLAHVHGPRVFDIFRQVWECSMRYPGSTLFQVYSGTASEEQLQYSIATGKNLDFYETNALLESVCCNDAAPWPMLQRIERNAYALSIAAGKRKSRERYRGHRMSLVEQRAKELVRVVTAALAIHPRTPPDERERLVKELRRRHVHVDAIRRVKDGSRVAIAYDNRRPIGGFGRRRRFRRHRFTVKSLRERAAMFDRTAKRMRKKARTLERKLAAKKRRKEKVLKAKTKRGTR